MDCRVLVILHVFGLFISSSHLSHEFHFVNLKMSWSEAQRYCRVKHTDLATVKNKDDLNRLVGLETAGASSAWIGLRDDPRSWKGIMGNKKTSWRWSATGNTSRTSFHNWKPLQPNNMGGKQFCVLMYSDGTWNDEICGVKNKFLCSNDTQPDKKNYTFIDEHLSWKDARAYCREHHTDLATIETARESHEVVSKKPAGSIWFGLYRVAWSWSDRSRSAFRPWSSGQPDNLRLQQHCASVSLRQALYYDKNCKTKLPFFCHGALKVKMSLISMRIQTDADLTDPAAHAQILQQLDAKLTNQGVSDFQLNWKIQPRKKEEREDDANLTDSHDAFQC